MCSLWLCRRLYLPFSLIRPKIFHRIFLSLASNVSVRSYLQLIPSFLADGLKVLYWTRCYFLHLRWIPLHLSTISYRLHFFYVSLNEARKGRHYWSGWYHCRNRLDRLCIGNFANNVVSFEVGDFLWSLHFLNGYVWLILRTVAWHWRVLTAAINALYQLGKRFIDMGWLPAERSLDSVISGCRVPET